MSGTDDGADLGGIAAAIGGLQQAFEQGMEAIGAAEDEAAAAGSDPTHEIVVDVTVTADVEGHPYEVDATLRYRADLGSVLAAPAGALADALAGLGMDAQSAEGAAVLEQLSKPRVVAPMAGADLRRHVLSSDRGPEDVGLDETGVMLVTLDGGVLRCSFERAFAYPSLQAERTVYCATPSGEAMATHVAVPVDALGEPVEFAWREDDRDGLDVRGTVVVHEI